MKNLGLTLVALLLASQAQASYTYLPKGTKFTCSTVPDNGFSITVEVKKELKPEVILDGKYAVKVTQSNESEAITSILNASDIATRTMAGGYYQVVVHDGKILVLKNLIYSIYKDHNPVGFYGKLVDLKYDYSTPVACKFVGVNPAENL